jgi:F-type H+-transporting ATPase subunit alpha
MNYNLETPSPSIISRESVIQPLTTGTQIVDTLFPLGRGQRQLLIGDQSTGKTSLAVTMIINQKQNNRNYSIDRKGEQRLFVVYVSIGNKKSEVAQIVRTLKMHNASWFTTIVYA